MRTTFLPLLLCAVIETSAFALFPGRAVETVSTQPTCGCTQTETTTVTKYAQELNRRQDACSTQTNLYFVPLETITVALSIEPSVDAQFASDSAIDSVVYAEQSQNAPTGEPWSKTMTWTHTATAPYYVATDAYPAHGTSIVYHYESYSWGPIATSTVIIGPSTPVAAVNTVTVLTTVNSIRQQAVQTGNPAHGQPIARTEEPEDKVVRQEPTITDASKVPGATCTMIFAQISGSWASWCNNWNGVTAISLPTSFATTVFATSGYNIPPVPESVVHPSSSSAPTPVVTSLVLTTALTITAPIATSVVTNQPVPPQSSDLVSSAPVVSTFSTAINVTLRPSSTSSAAMSVNTCGQTAAVLINFDDLPVFSTNSPEDPETPPVPTPYDHFAWSDGFGYGPPGPQRYLPHDGTRLGQFDPADANLLAPSTPGSMKAGSFGAGTRAYNNIFYFDAHSSWVGCNNTASSSWCDFTVTGYRWSPTNASLPTIGEEHEVFTQYFYFPPCATQSNCTLTEIFFNPDQFTGLSSMNLFATVDNTTTGFFIDDIAISWSNDTCEAGLARLRSRKRDVQRRSLW